MNMITPTGDNSNTLFNEVVGEHYHSKHGALQESKHVFIDAGLAYKAALDKEINILEVGFGTGLNFLLSLEYAISNNLSLHYAALETHPLELDLICQLGYGKFVSTATWNLFESHYKDALNKKIAFTKNITLEIIVEPLQTYKPSSKYDLIYFDAFSVRHQPELWSNEVIEHTCAMIATGGVFVTYAITGDLKRAVRSCGFDIQKLPGAPGKREMLRAIKNS